MGQIQNQLNQALAASLGGALAIGHSMTGYRALEGARYARQSAQAAAGRMAELVGRAKEDLKGVETLEQLQEFEDEYTLTDELYNAAQIDEAEAIEAERKAKLQYGTKKQRRGAAANFGDYSSNLELARQGSGLPDAITSMRQAIENKLRQQATVAERREILKAAKENTNKEEK